jgi:polysaccharide pyruvyl transferase WcaK-like protein
MSAAANENAVPVLSRNRADAGAVEERRGAASPRRSRTVSSRIVLFGLFGCGNLGNDGSLETMLGFLRRVRPDARIVCVCDEPQVVTRSLNVDAVPIRQPGELVGSRVGWILRQPFRKLRDFGHAWHHLSRAEIMIIPGTGILDDFGERPQGMPLKLLTWCLAARLCGTKIAFVCIGAGPIRRRVNRWLMLCAASLAHYRSYRDGISREFMESVGFDTTSDPVYPDIVFKLSAPEMRPRPSTDFPDLTVGVGVMSYRGWYGYAEGGDGIFARYIEKLSEFVIHLLDGAYGVRLLTGELGDSTAVDALLARVRAARPEVAGRIAAEPSYSLGDLMEQMSKTDTVVATRFHNIVCALKMGKPTISLGYARKNDVLMTEMGLADYCQHVEHFNVPTLIEHFDRLVENREALARHVRERVSDFDRQLGRQEEFLLSEFI